MTDGQTPWGPEYFIGGHPALDLANTVFDRHTPAADNELLRSPRDLASWLRAMGLADDGQARRVAERSDEGLLEAVRAVRETSFALFDAVAGGRDPGPEQLGALMSAAATGLQAGTVDANRASPTPRHAWHEPDAVTSLLAMVSVTAYFTLSLDRIRSCPRCGWLFADTSRGGKRRWCSMKTCGNREKASRHRDRPNA